MHFQSTNCVDTILQFWKQWKAKKRGHNLKCSHLDIMPFLLAEASRVTWKFFYFQAIVRCRCSLDLLLFWQKSLSLPTFSFPYFFLICVTTHSFHWQISLVTYDDGNVLIILRRGPANAFIHAARLNVPFHSPTTLSFLTCANTSKNITWWFSATLFKATRTQSLQKQSS